MRNSPSPVVVSAKAEQPLIDRAEAAWNKLRKSSIPTDNPSKQPARLDKVLSQEEETAVAALASEIGEAYDENLWKLKDAD